MSDYGITYKNLHSKRDVGLIMQSIDRTVLPNVKRQQMDIMSINGLIDLADKSIYANRIIKIKFAAECLCLEEMRRKVRQISNWLTGKSTLIFDDEAELRYNAKIYDAVSLTQTFKTIKCDVSFECSPFAYGRHVIYPFDLGVNLIEYGGNVETPTLTTIKNDTEFDVAGIDLSIVNRMTGRGTE